MTYKIIQHGESRSFPDSHPFVAHANPDGQGSVFIGAQAAGAFQAHTEIVSQSSFVAIELGNECLGVHLGDDAGPDNVVGFARFRLGDAAPTELVELVRMPYTSAHALDSARLAFEAAGLKVAVCNDFPGRILNRLLRP